MKNFIIVTLLFSGFILYGCNDDDRYDEWMPSTCQFYIVHHKFGEGYMSHIDYSWWGLTSDCYFISKGCKWTITSCPYWVTITPTSGGSGRERVQIKVDEFKRDGSRDSREGSVIIHIKGIDIETNRVLKIYQSNSSI